MWLSKEELKEIQVIGPYFSQQGRLQWDYAKILGCIWKEQRNHWIAQRCHLIENYGLYLPLNT